MSIDALFSRLWRDYVAVTPQAHRIHALLEARGESIRNDHIALRTFDRPGVDLEALAAPFLALGYAPTGDYVFPVKKLEARSFSHPDGHPRVFISELKTAAFSADLNVAVDALVAQAGPDLLAGGWAPPSCATYAALQAESEYAAWLAAFGIRANHFTVSVHDLNTFDDLAALNAFLLAEGFGLNDRGGVIKGGPEVCLAQSSTWADRVEWAFSDGPRVVPSCYYEFAERFEGPGGRLFDGFVVGSADKIFESTDALR